MADDVFWQGGTPGDQLSEGNLGKVLLSENKKDYVDRGGGITGPTNGEITVEAAQAFIEDTASEQLYKVYPSSETLALPNTSGDNYLYITFDPATQNSATYEITDTQGSGLTNPVSLLWAVIDGGAGTYETRNDAPSGTFESVNTERLNITDYSAVLEKTTSQSLSNGTDTTVDWDDQSIDTDIYSYDATTDTITLLASGDYRVTAGISFTDPTTSPDDPLELKIKVNGSAERSQPHIVSVDNQRAVWSLSVLLKNLSENDTIRIDAISFSTNGSDIEGNPNFSYCDISKEA